MWGCRQRPVHPLASMGRQAWTPVSMYFSPTED